MSEIKTKEENIKKLLDQYKLFEGYIGKNITSPVGSDSYPKLQRDIVIELSKFDKKTVEAMLCDNTDYSSLGPGLSGSSKGYFSCANRNASTTTMDSNSDSSRPTSTGSTDSVVSSLGFSDETDLSQFGSPMSDYSDSVYSLDGSVSDASTGSTASVGSASDGSLGSTTSLSSIDTLYGKPLTKLTLDDFKTMYLSENPTSIETANDKIKKLIK